MKNMLKRLERLDSIINNDEAALQRFCAVDNGYHDVDLVCANSPVTDIHSLRRFGSVHSDLEKILKRNRLERIVSSSHDKEKIDECVGRIEDVLKEFDLETSIATHGSVAEIHNDLHELRGRVERMSDTIMVSRFIRKRSSGQR